MAVAVKRAVTATVVALLAFGAVLVSCQLLSESEVGDAGFSGGGNVVMGIHLAKRVKLMVWRRSQVAASSILKLDLLQTLTPRCGCLA
jgi:hypothetical protein